MGFSCFSTLCAQERGSSVPYISGDSFRVYCDFTFDELNKKIDFNRVKNGSTIFVKTDYLEDFFKKVHPRIHSRYILVAHNSDDSSPGYFERYLDDDKLIAWFGQNIGIQHPKLHPIPIGIANRCFAHGNIDVVHKQQERAKQTQKDIFLYMNFAI